MSEYGDGNAVDALSDKIRALETEHFKEKQLLVASHMAYEMKAAEEYAKLKVERDALRAKLEMQAQAWINVEESAANAHRAERDNLMQLHADMGRQASGLFAANLALLKECDKLAARLKDCCCEEHDWMDGQEPHVCRQCGESRTQRQRDAWAKDV